VTPAVVMTEASGKGFFYTSSVTKKILRRRNACNWTRRPKRKKQMWKKSIVNFVSEKKVTVVFTPLLLSFKKKSKSKTFC